MSSLLLSPIEPASRTCCDQSLEVTEVIDEAGLSHGLAEDEASQSAMAWHESPSGGASPWQDCHKDGHGESVAGCNTANTGGSGADTDTADRMGDDGSDSGIAAPSNLEEQWEALEVGQRLWARSLLLPPLSHSLSLLLSVRPYAMNEDSNSHSNKICSEFCNRISSWPTRSHSSSAKARRRRKSCQRTPACDSCC